MWLHRLFTIGALTPLLVAGCAPPAARVLHPFEGITVRPDEGTVEVRAWSCLDAGWLEQVACAPGTREHESLVVITARPSDIHAALLLAGFEPGAPGRWSERDGEFSFTPPTGDRLRVLVRYGRDGRVTQEPVGAWMADAGGDPSFPDTPWVFTGSAFARNPEWMGPGEHYVADMTGSIIGLVTFGDEVIAFEEVFADQEAVEPLHWQVRSGYVPPLGTEVTIVLTGRP